MSIIVENEHGWYICCKTYFNKIYDFCKDEHLILRRLKFRDVFFEIKTPFFMNSKSQKISRDVSSKKYKVKKFAKSKKKCSEMESSDEEKTKFLINGTNSLVTAAKNLNYLEDSEVTAEDWFENNSKARKAASEILSYNNKSLGMGLHCETTLLYSYIRKFGDDEYVIPPWASFQLCDITEFFCSVDKKYDLIVLDPPWLNKSVKRKKSYLQLKYDSLRNLPLENITNPGCLIVVWITNSFSSFSYVTEELFPKCNVICSTLWQWCKVTERGAFVHPVDSHHKKPYENILLGRVAYNCDLNIRPFKEIDSKKLIVSVPSSIHSHKPPLVEILKPYLMPDACCLELFARYLLPGWKSVGNEVLKLQNIKLFDIVE